MKQDVTEALAVLSDLPWDEARDIVGRWVDVDYYEGFRRERDALADELKTARRMVHELQADNTRLVEERRAAVTEMKLRVREIEQLREGRRAAVALLAALVGAVEDDCCCHGGCVSSTHARYSSAMGQAREALSTAVTYLKPTIRDQVLEFHRAMDVPVLEKPAVPPDERVRLRLNLIAEEFFELLEASLNDTWRPREDLENIDEVKGRILWLIEDAPLRVNLPEFADALADLDYVIEGARLEFGIDGAPVAAEVHRANMTKTTGPVREDGKRLKGPDFKPPDILSVLKKQGWEP